LQSIEEMRISGGYLIHNEIAESFRESFAVSTLRVEKFKYSDWRREKGYTNEERKRERKR